LNEGFRELQERMFIASRYLALLSARVAPSCVRSCIEMNCASPHHHFTYTSARCFWSARISSTFIECKRSSRDAAAVPAALNVERAHGGSLLMTERVARCARVLPATLLEQRPRSVIVGRDALAVAVQLAEPMTCLAQSKIASARVQRHRAIDAALTLFL
jgi:hypothetical protein